MIGVTADVAPVQTIRTSNYEPVSDNVLQEQDQGGKQIIGNTPTEKIINFLL